MNIKKYRQLEAKSMSELKEKLDEMDGGAFFNPKMSRSVRKHRRLIKAVCRRKGIKSKDEEWEEYIRRMEEEDREKARQDSEIERWQAGLDRRHAQIYALTDMRERLSLAYEICNRSGDVNGSKALLMYMQEVFPDVDSSVMIDCLDQMGDNSPDMVN